MRGGGGAEGRERDVKERRVGCSFIRFEIVSGGRGFVVDYR